MGRDIEPSVTPPSSPPPSYPYTCCGFVCCFERALAFSKKKKKKALTTHVNMSSTHTHSSWHNDWKNQLPQSAPLIRMEMPLELGSDHEGTLKLAFVTYTVKLFLKL